MAAVLVQLRRMKANRKKMSRRRQIQPMPNDNDVVLNMADLDEDEDYEEPQEAETILMFTYRLFWRAKPFARRVYADIKVQIIVASMILANFLCNIVEKQVWPSGKVCKIRKHDCGFHSKCDCRLRTLGYKRWFRTFELFFNISFTGELIWNMYAHWLMEFWSSGWNVFDFITVAVSWLFELNLPLPGPLKLLRMVRALRVFRLFKRVKSLRKILESLARAVPGVMNAFLIMLIVMCIYAILAVDFFRDEGKGGIFSFESGATKASVPHAFFPFTNYTPHFNQVIVDGLDGTSLVGDIPEGYAEYYLDALHGRGTYATGRGNDWGHEYFGNFGKALFTLFQILTGDSWAEAIGRPVLEGWSPMGTTIFFVSFILLHSVVLINVVVAVLLEKMVTPEEEDEGPNTDDMLRAVESAPERKPEEEPVAPVPRMEAPQQAAPKTPLPSSTCAKNKAALLEKATTAFHHTVDGVRSAVDSAAKAASAATSIPEDPELVRIRADVLALKSDVKALRQGQEAILAALKALSSEQQEQ